jgi:UDP-N-acetylglucosamine 2-epimerase (non-hydrolysing)
MKIIHVVGARPNFMKAAPVIAALGNYPHVSQLLVHTGQHYDQNMSDIFFKELGLPEPDVNLEVGSGSHAVQTAEVMMRFEQVVLTHKPAWTLVYGDVNSTVAASLVCAKLGVPVAHVEAGLRSFDRTMPEEINRLVTDQIADLLFTPSADGDENLLREGVAAEKIHLVGNVMIDTLVRLLPQAEQRWPALQAAHNLSTYGLVTLHRPSNVDDAEMLPQIMTALLNISQQIPLLFPMHPRTRQRLHTLQLTIDHSQLTIIPPVGYLDFVALQQHARLIITDSGGIQEESTYLGVPCLTVRENTERPITITVGSNQLVGQDMALLQEKVSEILRGAAKEGGHPPLWDGRAGERIAEIITRGSK